MKSIKIVKIKIKEKFFYFLSNVIFKNSENVDSVKVKKILIIALDQIGDYCMKTLPVVFLARRIFPDAKVDLVVGSWVKDLAETNPGITEIKIFNSGKFDRSKKKWNFLRKLKALKALQINDYDLILNVRGSLGIFFWYLIKSPKNVCNLRTFNFSGKKVIRAGLFGEHNTLTWDDIFWQSESGKHKLVSIPPQVKESAKNILVNEGIDITKKIVSFNPWARSLTRRWSVEKWATLADILSEKYNVEIIVNGDPSSKAYVTDMVRHSKVKLHNLAGKTTLLELAALFKCSIFCVCIDSGPMHIAGILDTPVIGLFGPNNPRISTPLTKKFYPLFKDLPCSPCFENLMECQVECMTRISVNDVLTAVDRLCCRLNIF